MHPVGRKNHFISISTFEEQYEFHKKFGGITQEIKTDRVTSVRQHLYIIKYYMQRQLQNFYKQGAEE